MANPSDEPRIEVVDDDMARILRAKTGAERLKIEAAVRVDARRCRLARYATWTPEELEDFSAALASQRRVDAFRQS